MKKIGTQQKNINLKNNKKTSYIKLESLMVTSCRAAEAGQ